MSSASKFVRKHIQNMPAYQPILPYNVLSDELGIPIDQLIKLDANENPYGPLPEVFKTLSALKNIHIYPDPESRRIKALIARYHNIPEDSIVISAGADELIDLIMRVCLDPGDEQVNCPPTFGMYAFDGALNQARTITIPRRPDFSINLEGIQQAVVEQKPKILFLANPNNPDGGLISEEVFNALVQLPLLLVMDEAYIHFSDTGASVIHQVQKHKNLIVLRTFSKWAGLAGLRVGYGVFPTGFVPLLMKAKQPYNVSVVAEQAAVITMCNISKASENISRIIAGRAYLMEALAEIPWLETYPSQANFVLCRVKGIPAVRVKEQLRRRGILIRYFDTPRLSDHIRISVGTKEHIQQLITAIKEIR
jgi:histidinol-phosphate aminotransferase